MFCPNCGKEIPDGSAFCPECGNTLGAAPAGSSDSLIAGMNVVPANYLTYGACLLIIIGLFLPFVSVFGYGANYFGAWYGKIALVMAIAQIVLMSLPQTKAAAKGTNMGFSICSVIFVIIGAIVNTAQGYGLVKLAFGFYLLLAASIFWVVAAIKYKKAA